MKPTITENKKHVLSDYLKQLGNEISNLFYALENDESIPEDQFRAYEKQIEKLWSLHTNLEEEIYFS